MGGAAEVGAVTAARERYTAAVERLNLTDPGDVAALEAAIWDVSAAWMAYRAAWDAARRGGATHAS